MPRSHFINSLHHALLVSILPFPSALFGMELPNATWGMFSNLLWPLFPPSLLLCSLPILLILSASSPDWTRVYHMFFWSSAHLNHATNYYHADKHGPCVMHLLYRLQITESCCLCSHLSLMFFQYYEFHEQQQGKNSFQTVYSRSFWFQQCCLLDPNKFSTVPHLSLCCPLRPSLKFFLFLFFPLAFSLWNIFGSASTCLLDWLPSSWKSLTARCGILRYIFQKIHSLSRKTDKSYVTTSTTVSDQIIDVFVCKCMW